MSEAAPIDPQPTSAFWQALPADEVVAWLQADPAEGLDAAEASRRLASIGPNRLPEGKQRGPLMRFFTQLNNILVYVLLAAGFVKLMVDLWLDAATSPPLELAGEKAFNISRWQADEVPR